MKTRTEEEGQKEVKRPPWKLQRCAVTKKTKQDQKTAEELTQSTPQRRAAKTLESHNEEEGR